MAGFVYSQTLDACVRLRLFQHLQGGPLTTGALATALDLPQAATVRLLGAAHGLGLVEAAGPNRYALGAQGAALLGNAGLLEMIEHHAQLYADLGDSVGVAAARGGRALQATGPTPPPTLLTRRPGGRSRAIPR